MKSTGKFISFILLAVILISSCSKEPDADFPDDNIYALRSIVYEGEIINSFLYNQNGKISEVQTRFSFSRYIYDDNNRLVKEEMAFASEKHPGSGLMTSQEPITSYQSYEYGQDGLLKYIKYFRIEDGVVIMGSMDDFEYKDGNISKVNSLNNGDTILGFTAYEYDNNRNVINMKQYSYHFSEDPDSVLIRETTYKYDNKNNPYSIFKECGSPGVNTNTNNIVETNSTFYEDIPGIDKYTTSKTSYEYNDKGFPVKEIEGTSVFEYVYH